MVKQLLKALDAGFTAFCNELWLPTFGFHLFDDPADALEDAPEYDGQAMWRLGDVPVELAGSLSAPGDGPEVGDSPRSAPTSGQPKPFSDADWGCFAYAARLAALRNNDGFGDDWETLADRAMEHMRLAPKAQQK